MKQFWWGVAAGIAGLAGIQSFSLAAHAEMAPEISGALDRLASAIELTHANYVKTVPVSELVDDAINGMVRALDPNSSYMSAAEFKRMQAPAATAGVGLRMTMKSGHLVITSLIEQSPGALAGIRGGDILMQIDGAAPTSLNDAVLGLRGPDHSKISLTIVRPPESAPLQFELTRAIVLDSRIKAEAKGNVGYIQITSLNEETGQEIKDAVSRLEKTIGANLKGYILDLRDCPGGLLSAAIETSDDFLPGGKIVSTDGAHEPPQNYSAASGDIANGKPIIVLVNEGTASGAEIIAGALQDNHRAVIAGVRSSGAGSVQTILPVNNGGMLRLTTSYLHTPSGRAIQDVGIVPDLIVEPPPGNSLADFQLTFALGRLNGPQAGPP